MPAFSSKKARDFIQNELGAPVDEIFREFDDQPIAAASLGQVLFRIMIFCFSSLYCHCNLFAATTFDHK